MKKFSTLFSVLIACLISVTTIAQPAAKESNATEYISSRTINLSDGDADYTGSPYFDKTFEKGNISKNGKIIASNLDLRYNVSREEFELRDPANADSKIVRTLVRSTDVKINIGDNTFEYISSPENKLRGYFIVLLEGDKNSLYKKMTKKYYPAQKATNSMSADVSALYKDKEIIYLVNEQGVFTELPDSKGGKLKAFGDQKDTVKTYSKEQNLNLNKEDDLIQVVTYLDTL